MTHKIIHNPDNLPQGITELFTLNKQVHDYNTRNNEGLHAGKINTTTYGLRNISHQARLCRESIPNSIKDEVFVNSFFKKIKSQYHFHVLNKFNYELGEYRPCPNLDPTPT